MSTPEEKKQGRERYETAREMSLLQYATALGDSLSSRIDMLSKLIGEKHYPSEGAYKERLLLHTISAFLPSGFRAGTGFVLFPEPTTGVAERLRQAKHDVSRQLDIIVYDARQAPLVFSDGDFVVVRPESVRAIIEVKGAVDRKSIRDSVELFVDFSCKWGPYAKNHDACLGGQVDENRAMDRCIRPPMLILMGWASEWKDATRIPARMCDGIVQCYQEAHLNDHNAEQFPLITLACLYRQAIILQTPYMGDPPMLGYRASRGSIVDESNGQRSERDLTIPFLLHWVEHSLTGWSNPLYSQHLFAEHIGQVKPILVGNEALKFVVSNLQNTNA